MRMIKVPWSESGNRYTALFESLVIDWLKDAPISAVSRNMRLSWNAIAGIQTRAVERGLATRDTTAAYKQLGIDETSFRKRHDYVTVINDPVSGHVIYVCKDRTKKSVKEFYASLTVEQKDNIETVSMDMWPAYIGATEESIPDSESKIAFDKFHVAKYLGDAIDKVRRQENRELRKQEDYSLTGTKYGWLRNPENETHLQKKDYQNLRQSSLKTARAWAMKEHAMCLWHYTSQTWAEKAWQRWYGWASRSRLRPMIDVAWTLKRHMWGIVNAVINKADNAKAESLNSRIKTVKVRSRGFRNKDRFINAIYFHLGGLDLYPPSAKQYESTHTNG